MAAIEVSVAEQTVGVNETGRTIEFIRRNPTVVISASILIMMFLLAIFAPLLATDPLELAPWQRLKPPGDSVGSVQTILVGMFMQGLFTVPESLSV